MASLPPGRLLLLLLAMLMWRLGEQGWRFAVPLLLLKLKPGSLFLPSAYGMATGAATAFLGPSLGSVVDKSKGRVAPVVTSALVTGLAVAGGAAVMVKAAWEGREGRLWLWGGLAMAVGAVESLASMVTMVMLSRDWVPVLCRENAEDAIANNRGEEMPLLGGDDVERRKEAEEDLLSRTNSLLSTISLLGETVAPIVAGALLAVKFGSKESSSSVEMGGTLLVAGAGSLAPIVAVALLVSVHSMSKALQHPKHGSHGVQQHGGEPMEEEKTGFLKVWKDCMSHVYGVIFIILAYSSLYLSALSTHGIMLTSYLKTLGLNPIMLAGFRAAGAVSGVVGVSLFPFVIRVFSLRATNKVYIGILTASVAVAASMFFASDASSSWNLKKGDSLWIFMAFIVLSRAGLYGYEAGLMQHQQLLVDEKHRASMGGLENSLCSFATIVMYAMGMLLEKPDQFVDIVIFSFSAVALSMSLYFAWTFFWPVVHHSHGGEGEYHKHTSQDENFETCHSHPMPRWLAASLTS